MIIALLIWNVLLTAGLIYLAWRQVTFEKMVSRYAAQLSASFGEYVSKSVRLSKLSIGILVATFVLTVFKKFHSSNETPSQTP